MHSGQFTPRRETNVYRWRAGLTLVEVLVCLMLLSLLAAAVFPVVTQRVARAEPLRARDDLTAIALAMERFRDDLDGHLPVDLGQLLARPDSADRAIEAPGVLVRYTPEVAGRWSGPYLANPTGDGAGRITGFDVPIHHEMVLFDALASVPDGATAYSADSDEIHLAVVLGRPGRHLTAAQFEAIDDAIDGHGSPSGPGQGTSWTSGRLRFHETASPGHGVAYFLAIPLDP